MIKYALLLSLFASWAQAFIKDKSFLEQKIKVHTENIQKSKQLFHVPKEVIWLKSENKALVVPRENPWKREFHPGHPKANSKGMIYLPNIDLDQEKRDLAQAKKILKSL